MSLIYFYSGFLYSHGLNTGIFSAFSFPITTVIHRAPLKIFSCNGYENTLGFSCYDKLKRSVPSAYVNEVRSFQLLELLFYSHKLPLMGLVNRVTGLAIFQACICLRRKEHCLFRFLSYLRYIQFSLEAFQHRIYSSHS